MILLEFEVVDTDATHRHAFRLEDVREIISMENGARTSIRLECRERPIVGERRVRGSDGPHPRHLPTDHGQQATPQRAGARSGRDAVTPLAPYSLESSNAQAFPEPR